MDAEKTPDYEKLVRKFEHVYDSLTDLRSGLRTQGNYQVAGYVDRAVKALDDAISAVLADTANEPKPEPFGTYVERSDGSTEFRRTGEVHTPTAQAYTFWTLYSGQPPAREIVQPIKPLIDPSEVAPVPEDSKSSARLSDRKSVV